MKLDLKEDITEKVNNKTITIHLIDAPKECKLPLRNKKLTYFHKSSLKNK